MSKESNLAMNGNGGKRGSGIRGVPGIDIDYRQRDIKISQIAMPPKDTLGMKLTGESRRKKF